MCIAEFVCMGVLNYVKVKMYLSKLALKKNINKFKIISSFVDIFLKEVLQTVSLTLKTIKK